MNYIFIEKSTNYGGVEILTADLIKYMIESGSKVFFITQLVDHNRKNIYSDLLKDISDGLNIINVPHLERVMMYEDDRYQEDKKIIKEYISEKEDYCLITYYFRTMQYGIRVLEGYSKIRILYLWPHPLQFILAIPTFPKAAYAFKRKKNKMYYYQKKLFELMHKSNASFYSSRSIFDYNNWFYETNLEQKKRIECDPVRTIKPRKQYHYDINSKKISVLWVGRFDFFKNDAIAYIYKNLNEFASKYPGIMFELNIVGGGNETFTNDLKSKLNPGTVDINYLGLKKPDELPDIYVSNDIGIAMGLTVKQMAMCGLPAILIDSLNDNYKTEKYCTWIYETSEGDAGDGAYYYSMGKPLTNRNKLSDILSSVIKEPASLNQLSMKCTEFVKKYYSLNTQNQKIIEAAEQSQLCVSEIKPFIYSLPVRRLYSLYIKYRDRRL